MEDVASLLRLDPNEENELQKFQNLFSIIKTLDYLEWAYMSGKVKGSDYDSECRQLLHLFKMQSGDVPNFNLDNFVKEYNLMHCQSAQRRIKDGRSGYKGEDVNVNLS